MSSHRLVGHEPIMESLRNALARGRLGHAFLLVGPEGIGKRRAAEHIAQSLLCETHPAAALDPCGRCAACVQVAGGAHPDFFCVERPEDKNVLPIELVQDLCQQLGLKPARGRFKIALVDDADLLEEESANCFLKTLEEPPPHSLLLLVATSVEGQLPTIVSRCQLLRFSSLADDVVARLLLELGTVTDPAEAARYAQWAGGSVGVALRLANPAWLAMRDRLFRGLSEQPVDGIRLAADLRHFIDEAGKDSAAKRFRARQLVRMAADFYRDLLARRGAANDEPARDSHRPALPEPVLLDLIERCLETDYHLARFLNQTLTIDCWIDDLTQITAGRYVPPVGSL